MNELLVERQVTCPACWEAHITLIDLSDTAQNQLIEDCTVCCNPMQITFSVVCGEVVAIDAEPAN